VTGIELAPAGREPVDLISASEVEALIAACSALSATGGRNRALIIILARAGLRIGEALALHAEDVDQATGVISIKRGPGCKPRTVGLDAASVAVIGRWMEMRAKLGVSGHDVPVFSTLRGRPLTADYVRALLPRLGRKAAISKRVHAQGLRDSLAIQLSAEGWPVAAIQKQLGHANIATTARLIGHANSASVDVVALMRGRTTSCTEGGADTQPPSSGNETTQKRPEV